MADHPAPALSKPEHGVPFYFSAIRRWCAANSLLAVQLGLIIGTLIYFFCFVHIFVDGTQSATRWAWQAWNTEAGLNQEHSKLVIPIALFLVWYHREKIRTAPKQGSNHGLFFIALGLLSFVLSARCLQPRMALTAVPFVIFGTVLYLWGRNVARIILFPCAFLIFMIPFGALEQATGPLQGFVTGTVSFLTNMVGIAIQTVGTTIHSADNSFNFEIAEGCSGVKSLTAMTMLTTVFVHLTQKELWKKIIILGFSAVFAIIGNAGRIFTVILVARFYDPKIAGGIYHDYSGYIFFPIALMSMLGFSKLINLDFKHMSHPESKGPQDQVSYDY